MSKSMPMQKQGTSKKNASSVTCVVASLHKTELIQDQFIEQEILKLQENFLKNGFHYVQIPDAESGRMLIKTFLTSLGCYHNVAHLTLDQMAQMCAVTDLYGELVAYAGEHSMVERLDEFMVEQFFYDFLWIELSEQLSQKQWFEVFKRKLIDLHIVDTLPIMLLCNTETISKS